MDIFKIARDIETRGFTVVPLPTEIRSIVASLEDELASIPSEDITKFSFPDVIDGFLPYGLEHAEGNPDHPDLCERFCYWRSRRDVHNGFAISRTKFYSDVAFFERFCEESGNQIMKALAAKAGAPSPGLDPEYSYVQLGIYAPKYAGQKNGREYLMDPHVDGQLLTFIVNTAEGLLVEEEGRFVSPKLRSDQMLIMAGKLLEILSDGEIEGVNHAVEENAQSQRLSLIYFMNPDFSNRRQKSWRDNRDIDFFSIANKIHAAFGNPAYETSDAS